MFSSFTAKLYQKETDTDKEAAKIDSEVCRYYKFQVDKGF
jgi:hypothetical protein